MPAPTPQRSDVCSTIYGLRGSVLPESRLHCSLRFLADLPISSSMGPDKDPAIRLSQTSGLLHAGGIVGKEARFPRRSEGSHERIVRGSQIYDHRASGHKS